MDDTTETADAADALFSPFSAGALELQNRIVMAPLTRGRAGPGDVPTEVMVEYYRQRAGAGLIITEATFISPEGKGWPHAPGVYSDAQAEAWAKVTEAVHAEGGKIVVQLWHMGRISHSSLQPGGRLPVAPSAVKPAGKARTEEGPQEYETPRALDADELPRIIEDYRNATRKARAAGFDGVEIHSANGYLLDQFLRDGTNQRMDAFGGSPENRARFPLMVADAVVGAWEPGRVGIRISPVTTSNDMSDSDPQPTFEHYVDRLDRLGLAYIHVVEGVTQGPRDFSQYDPRTLRRRMSTPYMANNGYDRAMAIEAVESGRADLVAFGRPFIANPDLPDRLRIDAPLAAFDRATFYEGGAKGYTDYPTLAQTPAEAAEETN